MKISILVLIIGLGLLYANNISSASDKIKFNHMPVDVSKFEDTYHAR